MPNLKKLLDSKWSAVHPKDREKHFVVTRVIDAKRPHEMGPRVELEAIHSKRRFEVLVEELADPDLWCRGWS